MGQLPKKGKKKQTVRHKIQTIRHNYGTELQFSIVQKWRVCCAYPNAESATGDVQPTGQNLDLDREFKADIARYWSQFNAGV
jgi:hypothetical protein